MMYCGTSERSIRNRNFTLPPILYTIMRERTESNSLYLIGGEMFCKSFSLYYIEIYDSLTIEKWKKAEKKSGDEGTIEKLISKGKISVTKIEGHRIKLPKHLLNPLNLNGRITITGEGDIIGIFNPKYHKRYDTEIYGLVDAIKDMEESIK